MPSNVSILHLLVTSLIYLFTQYRKCYSFTAIASTLSPSSSLLHEGAINITAHMSDEQRLFYTIMTGYEKAIRPLKKSSEAVVVKLGISLTQILGIISYDERNQIMTTNIWLDQFFNFLFNQKRKQKEWNDAFLKWNPKDFGGLKKIRIACRLIWLPDIVLYNSADDYTQGYMQSLAMIDYNGWK
ncbi:unnamed protein product [Rotaria sordida]|uniref:Neurotransmitter-gated ion-channel ligand-binding domain-containing protein n=1 Tax=Rotaria sordida TaxID=392033 RepID=A0A815RT92_9BILA|nr:unnamed protein product [Rotaria sordida]